MTDNPIMKKPEDITIDDFIRETRTLMLDFANVHGPKEQIRSAIAQLEKNICSYYFQGESPRMTRCFLEEEGPNFVYSFDIKSNSGAISVRFKRNRSDTYFQFSEVLKKQECDTIISTTSEGVETFRSYFQSNDVKSLSLCRSLSFPRANFGIRADVQQAQEKGIEVKYFTPHDAIKLVQVILTQNLQYQLLRAKPK